MAEDDFDLSKYDYVLPPELIAQKPVEPRDASRLLAVDRATGTMRHLIFRDIASLLRAGDLLVLNNTKVFPARTRGTRSTGGKVEVFFVRDLGRQGLWEVMLRSHGKPKFGEYLELEEGRLTVKLAEKLPSGHWKAVVPAGVNLLEKLDEIGRTPLPPYIKRETESAADRARYQTVFASEKGAVAAPTAGLHFTPELLERIRASGVRTTELTLHVGPGTFQPVKVDDIRAHQMHEEYYSISEATAQAISETRDKGGRVIPVGTTACRALEAAAASPEGFRSGSGWTDIYIYPPYRFRLTDALITNFHLPKSSLMLLVAAFAGRERILQAYEEAKRLKYRFYSYGDAMIIADI